MLSSVLFVAALLSTAWCCPQHDNYLSHPHLGRRQVRIDVGREPKDWNYDHSADWATIRPEYLSCQTGVTQSPINLPGHSLSSFHIPDFSGYPNSAIPGNLFNWQFAPAWTPTHPKGEVTGLPSFKFDDRQVFNIGWHIHAPSEHQVDGHRSRAEFHFVHSTAEDEEASVIGIRIGVAPAGSNYESAFVKSLGPLIHFNDTSQLEGVQVNMRTALEEVGLLREFWTYRGSLTTPPCSEGLRWFIPRQELLVSEQQMVDILAVSRFSHRVPQEIWLHHVNGM